MGNWLGALIGGIGSMIASGLANKTVFTTSLVAGALALTGAFIAGMQALTVGLYGSLPSWAVGLGYFIPNNASVCFSAIISARIARWIYDYHMSILKTAVQV